MTSVQMCVNKKKLGSEKSTIDFKVKFINECSCRGQQYQNQEHA